MAAYAVFPSPSEHTGHFSHQLSQKPNSTSRNLKPKLSLNTSMNRSLGKGTSSLRLDTMATSSPTSCNTYRNVMNSPAHTSQWDSCTVHSESPQYLSVTQAASPAIHASPESSASTDEEQSIPYSLPTNARSILTNGPFAKRHRQTSTSSASSSASSDQSSLAPSSSKRVCFRDPLSEDIQNTHYLLSHSDIPSRPISPSVPDPASEEHSMTSQRSQSPKPSTCSKPYPKASETAPKALQPECNEESSCGDLEEGSDADEDGFISPATPVSSSHPRDRAWVWTLGPLEVNKASSSSIKLDPQLEEEDLDDSLGESVAAASAYYLS